ncbi:leucine-rich repeat receptor-like serine/threonine-protein kinase At1g17230 [Cornus florida]|uniref:leucine-rich repeat receptor-like serine/threonine-protein kinase At1g17230 n=1 Tax=Cornus florida TaxID=4283 RepID=UPI0028A255A0|nr:leucine-rich repeat receptor-like serine/threonine-protein kinase At1g17230 [Cornus florida]
MFNAISLFLHLSLSSLIITTQSTTLPSEISALQSFKSSIKPSTVPSYSCLASWNFTSDPCSLPHITHFTCGLTCSKSFRVTQLTLDPAGYSGTLSPLISKLTQLTILDLADNNFYGPIPSSLSSLHSLQTLILRSNSFSNSVPPSIANLKSLQSIDFSRNSLSGSLPNGMNFMISLRRLDLSFNKLTGSLPKLPPNLVELAVKSNSLSGPLSKSSFDGLTQLEVIELSENWLAGTLQPWFFFLPALQQVNLANNSLARVEIWQPTKVNSDLVAVDLSFNKIEGNLPINLSGYPLLSSMSLRYNRLRGPIPGEFSKKQSLRRLFLDGNFLNGTPPGNFFSGVSSVSGSLGDNCLSSCPVSSQLCLKSQKPTSVCRQAYGGKSRS